MTYDVAYVGSSPDKPVYVILREANAAASQGSASRGGKN